MRLEPQILQHPAVLEAELLRILLAVAVVVALATIIGVIHGLRAGVPAAVAWLALASAGASLLAGAIIWHFGF